MNPQLGRLKQQKQKSEKPQPVTASARTVEKSGPPKTRNKISAPVILDKAEGRIRKKRENDNSMRPAHPAPLKIRKMAAAKVSPELSTAEAGTSHTLAVARRDTFKTPATSEVFHTSSSYDEKEDMNIRPIKVPIREVSSTEAEGLSPRDKIPTVITELVSEGSFDTYHDGAIPISEPLMETISDPADETFATRLVEYVQLLPENDQQNAATERLAIVLESMMKTAVKIQKLQEHEVAPELLQKSQEELVELCTQFLKSLDVEIDEKVVTRLVEKMLKSDYTNIKIAHLSPQELAKLGTHEYKLEEWFHKLQQFKQLLDATLHPTQSVGRLALWKAASVGGIS